MLKIGLRIPEVRYYNGERQIGVLSRAGIHPDCPFMPALSQAAAERLLARALEAQGGGIERGIKMVECRNLEDGVEAVIEPSVGGCREVAHCPFKEKAQRPPGFVNSRRPSTVFIKSGLETFPIAFLGSSSNCNTSLGTL